MTPTSSNNQPAAAMNAAEIRQAFPQSLLRRGEAIRLMRELGLSRYTLEQWCADEAMAGTIRTVIGQRRQWLYKREGLLIAAGIL